MCNFSPGQCWLFSRERNHENARFIIRRIDKFERAGTLVHVSVYRELSDGAEAQSFKVPYVTHVPFVEEAIRASAIAMESYVLTQSSEFDEAYAEWRSAFDRGTAGFFTASVMEVLNLLENSVDQGALSASSS